MSRIQSLQLTVLLMLCGFFTATYAGSPFYLTAEHSFTDSEPVTIRLDYTVTDQPMMIRVLKAKDLDKFLDGQFNISRSYEPAVSELNPGYYFAKGLNKAQSPLQLIRDVFKPDFRNALKDSSFNHAIISLSDKPLVSVPQQLMIAAPVGFQVIKENYLDLQHNGENTQDLAWWFQQDSWSDSRYKTRQINLEQLPDGIYLVQAVQGKTEAQCLIQVSHLSAQVKQSSEQLLVRVMNRDLQAVAGAKVSYRDGRGVWQALAGVTDALGELRFNNPEGVLDGKLLVRVETPSAKADEPPYTVLTLTDFLPAQAKDQSVFVMTDRPIFKPGETFNYKGIVRTSDHGQLKIPAFQSRETSVSLLTSKGESTDLEDTVTLTDFGSFSGRFTLDDAQTPGLYQLLAEIDHKPYAGEFRVRDYVKPSFYLEWLEHGQQVQAGQPFKLKFQAKRYSGGVPQAVKFEVFLYRKKFEVPQFVADAGAALSAGNDYFGQVKTAAPLSQPQRLFSSTEARNVAELSNPWETAAQLEANGEGNFEFTVPSSDGEKPNQEWVYTLMVRAQDQNGSMAILSDNLYATLSEAQPAIRFNKTVAAVGEQDLQLFLQSNYADGKPAANAEGVVEISLDQPGADKRSLVKLPFATDAQGQQKLAIPALQNYGRLTAIAKLETLQGHGLSHPAQSQAATLIVAGNGGEAVADNPELELYTPTTILSPGEQAKIFALLPKAWGKQEAGPIWETIAGERIFDSHAVQQQGRSRWFEVTAKPEYGTGFYHTVTVPVAGGKYKEQTLGFRIIPKQKRLMINIKPETAEAEPLKPTKISVEVKRADGKPAANTELAVAIVDRSVYAVQAEFRPNVFDFFYPLQRNNLATFYSDELQGYGYADLLRKPNFALSALKSQSKLAKKAMRDTAGWFPHVVTDANGLATVNVDMPANVTEWQVTVVASDKEGRMGENTGQFRTATDVNLDLLGAQFLRHGDEVELALKLTNQLNQAVKINADIQLSEALQLQNGGLTQQTELAAKGEKIIPLRLLSAETGTEASVSVALNAGAKVKIGGMESFDMPLKPASLSQIYNSKTQGERLLFDLPQSGQPQQLTVRVNSGLLGASLQAAEMLVQYPYGCTEQLAHSTIPNLVLMDLLNRAKLKSTQWDGLISKLDKAQRNAEVGIRKLLANQKEEGGFSLWPNEPEASLPVTLIAMEALSYAKELNLSGADMAFSKAQDWLANHVEQLPESQFDDFVLGSFAVSGNSYNAPWEKQANYVKTIAANPQAKAHEMIAALRILRCYEKLKWHSFNQQLGNTQQLRVDLINRLQQALQTIEPVSYQSQVLYQQLGFRFGLPSLIAAGLGELELAKALPVALEAKLKRQLLERQENGYWQSTYETAKVIFNARAILSKEAAAHSKLSNSSALSVSGKNAEPLGRLTAIPGGYVGQFDLAKAQADVSEIQISNLKADDVANASLSVSQPYADLTARASGLSVERQLYRITPKGHELLDSQQSLKLGDLVVSEVKVKRLADNSQSKQGSEFVVIDDGIPSLAEALENDQTYLADAKLKPKDDSYWALIKQTLRYPDRTERVAKLMQAGEIQLYQVWRVNRPGSAVIPPATVVDMYQETLQGNTAALRVNVTH